MHDIIILNEHFKNIFIRQESEDSNWMYSYDYVQFNDLGEGPYVIKNETKDNSEVFVRFVPSSESKNNLFINKITQFFIIGCDNITFDGGIIQYYDDKRLNYKKKIKITNKIQSGKIGLFQNGDKDIDGFSGIKILNMDYYSDDPYFFPGHGRFLQPYFGKNKMNFTFQNLYNYSNISGNYTSGIAGECVCQNALNVIFYDCINFGTVGLDNSQHNCSGIIGGYFLDGGDHCVINNCINFGTLESNDSSGIIGCTAFQNVNGPISIYKSYNAGAMNGQNCTGLVGFFSFCNLSREGKITVNNCFNSGKIGTNCVGLLGNYSFNNSVSIKYSVYVSNCYNNANITGNNSSGLVGSFCFNNFFSSANITNCYFNGNILPNQQNSGLVGNNIAIDDNDRSYIYITNCYASSNINNNSCIIGNIYNNNRVIIQRTQYSERWNANISRNLLTGVADKHNQYNNFNIDQDIVTWVDPSNFFYNNMSYILSSFKSTEYLFNDENDNYYAGQSIESISLEYNQNQYAYISSSSEFYLEYSVPFVEYAYQDIYFQDHILTNENLLGGDYKSLFVVLNKHNVLRGYEILTINVTIINNQTLFWSNTVTVLDNNNVESEVQFKDLKIGDLVKIYNNTYSPILYIYKKYLVNMPLSMNFRMNDEKPKNKLYIFFKSDYPEILNRDLIVMGGQNILVDGLTEKEDNMLYVMGFEKNNLLHTETNKYKLETYVNEKSKDYDLLECCEVYNIVLYSPDLQPVFYYVNGHMLTQSMCPGK